MTTFSCATDVETHVLAIVHSQGARERAVRLLGSMADVSVAGPFAGIRGIARAAWVAASSRSRILYLVDVGRTTTVAAVVGRLLGKPVIVDTGDACFALARSLGDRRFLGLIVVGAFEKLTLRLADAVVVRGRGHLAHVPGHAEFIPDLPPPEARPLPAGQLRAALGLEHRFVVGLVGSLILSERRRVSYGWDLVEALAYTDDDVVALIVGDGSGLDSLRDRARDIGVSGRCRFVGRVATAQIAEYVSAMDVAISTQTNDIVGQVRTTGKLPLYLACGRPVIASHVGEAAHLLGPLGWTLPYDGVVDDDYPQRLAQAIEALRADSDGADARTEAALRIARDAFDVDVMRRRLSALIDQVALAS